MSSRALHISAPALKVLKVEKALTLWEYAEYYLHFTIIDS